MFGAFLLIIITIASVSALTSFVKVQQAKTRGIDLNFLALFSQGMLASLCIPLVLGISESTIFHSLFALTTTSNDANNELSKNSMEYFVDYLKLIGLFVIASMYADGFLDKVSDAIMRGIKETNDKIREHEDKIQQQQHEIDETGRALVISELSSQENQQSDQHLDSLTKQQHSLLKLFADDPTTKYKKTVDLAVSIELDTTKTNTELTNLKKEELVDHISKFDAWYLTPSGKSLATKIKEETNG